MILLTRNFQKHPIWATCLKDRLSDITKILSHYLVSHTITLNHKKRLLTSENFTTINIKHKYISLPRKKNCTEFIVSLIFAYSKYNFVPVFH